MTFVGAYPDDQIYDTPLRVLCPHPACRRWAGNGCTVAAYMWPPELPAELSEGDDE